MIESLFELVPVGRGTPAVWDPTTRLQEIVSRDHGHIQPLSKVGFKNNDSLNVGPSMQILFSGAVVCEIHIAEERKVVQVGPLGSNDKRMQL